jgi:hypothetical protein
LFNSSVGERGVSWAKYRKGSIEVEIYRHYMIDKPRQWKVKVSSL